MSYFADLAPYSYLPDTIPPDVVALNVGWLDAEHSYQTGTHPEGFAERLFELCQSHPHAQTRGFQDCVLCRRAGVDEWPVTATFLGTSTPLGDAEVRVIDDVGTWLVAPNLVFHYVVEHEYQPPSQFVDAVMAGRLVV
ncbi:MAG: hypothetical protein ABIQ18_33315 [Umezawaea sp.]